MTDFPIDPLSERFIGALVAEGLRALDSDEAVGRTVRKKALFLVETFDNVILHETAAQQRTDDLIVMRDTLIAEHHLPLDRSARQRLLQQKNVSPFSARQDDADAIKAPPYISGPIPGEGSVIGAQNKGVDPEPGFQRPLTVRSDLPQRIRDLFSLRKEG